MPKQFRVGVLAVFHETNTFSPVRTDRAAFAHRWLTGPALVDAFAGTRTVVGGLLDSAIERGIETVGLFGTYATPAGTVTGDAWTAIRDAVSAALAGAPSLDGVLLELHGAMVVEGSEDPEAEIVELVRSHIGSRPISAVLDLHANLGTRRLANLDLLTGYRTNPHVDTYETGRRAAARLADALGGAGPFVRVHRGVPVMSAPIAQQSAVAPLRDILELAGRELVDRGLVDITVHAGYAYADVPHLGMGVSVTARAEQLSSAEAAAEAVATEIRARCEQFRRDLLDPVPGFAAAVRQAESGRLVAVVDTGDNVNGGAPGDGTWLLAEALARPDLPVLASIFDPEAVEAAVTAGPGGQVELELGGRSHASVGRPLPVQAEVRNVGDGTFVNAGPMATGATVSMGTAAVLRVGRCDIVVQERAVQPNDPQLFCCLGLDPADYRIVLLKGAAAVRAGWSELVSGFVDVATPGISDSRIERLPFEHRPHPLWPLEVTAG